MTAVKKGMNMCCRNFLFLLWPPYEAHVANKDIQRRTNDDCRWEEIHNDVEASLSEGISFKELEATVSKTQDYEIARKNRLESKAQIFASGGSLAAGALSIIPALYSSSWGIPPEGALLAGVIYLVAIIHLWVAAYFGIKTRQVQGLASPNASSLINELKNGEWNDRMRAVTGLANTKWNEDYLLLKSNYLSVAERMFLRGLACIATAAIISVAIKLLAEHGITLFTTVGLQ